MRLSWKTRMGLWWPHVDAMSCYIRCVVLLTPFGWHRMAGVDCKSPLLNQALLGVLRGVLAKLPPSDEILLLVVTALVVARKHVRLNKCIHLFMNS